MPDIFSRGEKVFVEGEDPDIVLPIPEDEKSIYAEGESGDITTEVLDQQIASEVDPGILVELLGAGIYDGDEFSNVLSITPFEIGDIFEAERIVYVEVSTDDMTLDQKLVEWANGKDVQLLNITRDGDGRATSATAKWPDESEGTFTATDYNSTFEVYDGYMITHSDSGKTVTQPAVTRNSIGAITVKPELIIV